MKNTSKFSLAQFMKIFILGMVISSVLKYYDMFGKLSVYFGIPKFLLDIVIMVIIVISFYVSYTVRRSLR
jgi:hypothetical protein